MYRGFPTSLLATLRCPQESGVLTLQHSGATAPEHVKEAQLQCGTCGRTYPIIGGIVRLLDPASLEGESKNEREVREKNANRFDPSWENSTWNEMETTSTLDASEPLAGARVLELGAGTGRYTVRMAERKAVLVALDFSLTSLEKLATRVADEWQIGLAQADVSKFAVAPESFDLVASTLVSNLPTPQHRAAMMKVAAVGIKKTGKFVFSTHHFNLRARWRGEPQSGRYREVEIYRYLFRQKEIRAETSPYFADVTCRPMHIAIPFVARLGLPLVKLSRIAEHVPFLNKLGELLLVVARQPRTRASEK